LWDGARINSTQKRGARVKPCTPLVRLYSVGWAYEPSQNSPPQRGSQTPRSNLGQKAPEILDQNLGQKSPEILAQKANPKSPEVLAQIAKLLNS